MSHTSLTSAAEARHRARVPDHDHAWRLDKSSRTDPRYARPLIYRCDLCPVVWAT
jgi:hypothetical protein